MAEVTICNDFGAPKIKSVTVSIVSPSICHEVMGPENKDHGIWSHHFMGNRWGNSGNSGRLYFGGSKIIADGDCSHVLKDTYSLEESYDQPRKGIQKQRRYSAN